MSQELLTTESGSVGGFGTGAFLLIFFWVVSILAALFLIRAGKAIIAVAVCLVVAAVSLVLIFLPREDRDSEKDITIYDGIFWPRLALIVGLLIFLLIGAAVSVLENLQVVHSKKM